MGRALETFKAMWRGEKLSYDMDPNAFDLDAYVALVKQSASESQGAGVGVGPLEGLRVNLDQIVAIASAMTADEKADPGRLKPPALRKIASRVRCVHTLVPIRSRRRGERRSLRTLSPGVSLRPPLAFNPDTPRRLSTPTDAFELHPDVALYGTTLSPSFGVGEKDVRDVIYQVAMMRVTFRRVARAVKSGSSAMPTSPEAFAAIVTKSQEESTPEQRVEDAKSLRGAYAGNSPCICGSGKRYKNCCDA
jgi:hypothetical protein